MPITIDTPETKPDDRLCTVLEVSRILNLSRSTIYGLLDAGRLRHARLPGTGARCSRRIPLSEVRRLIEDSMVGS